MGALGILGAIGPNASEAGPDGSAAPGNKQSPTNSIIGQPRYKSVCELIGAAGTAYEQRTGEASALPLPQMAKPGGALRVVILYYRESTRFGDETVFPPHHMVSVDPASAKVVEARPCTPAQFGLALAPGAATRGLGLDPAMPASEFWTRTDRFMELSPTVWALYAERAIRLAPPARAIVAEYDACLRRIAKTPLLPYYEAVAGDFFDWLDKVLGREPKR